MKRKLACMLALVMVLSVLTVFPATAALSPIFGTVLNDQLNFTLNGASVVPVGDDGTPVLPITYNSSTYLPLRAMGYLLGLGIEWDAVTGTVLITSTTTKGAPTATKVAKANTLIPISGALLNGDLKFKLDGVPVVPAGADGNPVLPISFNGTTYLPVRAMGNMLGKGIDWDGPTRTVVITSEPGTATTPGWYFTSWEYIIAPDDGAKRGHFTNGDGYTDFSEGNGEKNNFIISLSRVGDNGKTIAAGSAEIIWTDPPAYFGADDLPAITVKRTVESGWGINAFSISFDGFDVNPGGGTSSTISFVTPDGARSVQEFDGIMTAQKMHKGAVGNKKAIILHQNWYGFKYYYEWRE